MSGLSARKRQGCFYLERNLRLANERDSTSMNASVPHPDYPQTVGALLQPDDQCRFLVWAPRTKTLELVLPGSPERVLPMEARERGYHELVVTGLAGGTPYFYRIDGERDRPDPASRFQPEGVHGPSAVVDSRFDWTDEGWYGVPLHQYVIYELHPGTFSREGTLEAIIPHLKNLRELGVTAVELMPLSQFPGDRNWGYDGVHPFSVQNTYGGPESLRRLVDAAHAEGLAVVLDVVYNHLGPEGNYLAEFAHYFTDKYDTPWGQALNFDDRDSDEVRRYFIENALYWIQDFHIDALRLDAVHSIFDLSAHPFLLELSDAVRLEGERLNRHVYTIAESALNDPRMITPKAQGGYGLDTQWSDDMHHAIRSTITGEQAGYYEDFRGFDDIVKAWRDGYVLTGRYSKAHGRRHGESPRHLEPFRLVVYCQNHDQVGNRLKGDRLPDSVGFEGLKLAAASVTLSPYTPMLFMGEEYGETAPFPYFVSHSDPGLVEAVRRGRKEEFASFGWEEEPPDPQAEETFLSAKLNHELKEEGRHRVLWTFYQRLIELRRTLPALAFPSREHMEIQVLEPGEVLFVRRWSAGQETCTIFHYGKEGVSVNAPLAAGRWEKLLDSADPQWDGPGGGGPEVVESSGKVPLPLPPESVSLYRRVSGEGV